MAVDYSLAPWLGQPADLRRLPLRQQNEREQQDAFERAIQTQTQQREMESAQLDNAERRQRMQELSDKAAAQAAWNRDYQTNFAANLATGMTEDDAARSTIYKLGPVPGGGAGFETALARQFPPRQPTTTPPPAWTQQPAGPAKPSFQLSPSVTDPGSTIPWLRTGVLPPSPTASAAPQPMIWNGRQMVANPAYTKPSVQAGLDLRKQGLESLDDAWQTRDFPGIGKVIIGPKGTPIARTDIIPEEAPPGKETADQKDARVARRDMYLMRSKNAQNEIDAIYKSVMPGMTMSQEDKNEITELKKERQRAEDDYEQSLLPNQARAPLETPPPEAGREGPPLNIKSITPVTAGSAAPSPASSALVGPPASLATKPSILDSFNLGPISETPRQKALRENAETAGAAYKQQVAEAAAKSVEDWKKQQKEYKEDDQQRAIVFAKHTIKRLKNANTKGGEVMDATVQAAIRKNLEEVLQTLPPEAIEEIKQAVQ